MTERGDTIRLLHTSDSYTCLVPGDTGEVVAAEVHQEEGEVIHVRWAAGSTLSLLECLGDRWEVLT